jgi:Zn-dependent peptidase ImmA (M78 family)
MKLPKKLNILGRTIKVIDAPIKGCYGVFYPLQSEIVINTPIIKDHGLDVNQTLIHEMIHVVMNRTGLDQIIDPQVSEIICETIANSMVDNFKIGYKK